MARRIALVHPSSIKGDAFIGLGSGLCDVEGGASAWMQGGSAINTLIRKLELFGPLSDGERSMLGDVTRRSRVFKARQNIIEEGQEPSDVHLVMEGFACRYKILLNGRRQIFGFLLPGDFCDLNVFILRKMDHSIATMGECRVVDISRDRILAMTANPGIVRALWWATLVDEATLREWLVNMGQRNAEHRTAHLFCELHLRLQSVGLVADDEFDMPLTQIDLADTLGVSTVHLNRAVQLLRAKGLIILKERRLVIRNIGKLRAMCDFNPNYLHLDGGKHN